MQTHVSNIMYRDTRIWLFKTRSAHMNAVVEWRLAGKNRKIRRKTCPRATSSIMNLTWNYPILNLGLRREKTVSSRLSYSMACPSHIICKTSSCNNNDNYKLITLSGATPLSRMYEANMKLIPLLTSASVGGKSSVSSFGCLTLQAISL